VRRFGIAGGPRGGDDVNQQRRAGGRRGLIAVGAATLVLGTLAVPHAADAAATPDLWVATPGLGGQAWNRQCLPDAPCPLQQALDLAAGPANAGRPVTIHLGPGTFGAATIAAGTESSLTFTGYASSGMTATVLSPGPIASGQLDALRIEGVSFPVTVSHLSIAAAPSTAPAGADGTTVHGIVSLSAAQLTVDDVRITGLTGGDAGAGGRGGDVLGIAHAGATAISDTVISGLRGGAGGPGAAAETASPGGTGGLAASVVVSLPAGADLTVDRSQFTDNTGGRGGAGGAWSDGDHHGVSGGDGGSAVGVQANGDAVSINAVTVAGMRGGWGGTGGPGHAAQGPAKAGTDGGVGSGGEADGLLLTGVGRAAPAALSVTNSTISDNTGGAGGSGGSGAGISLGLPAGGTGRATLVHNTVVNNAGAAGATEPSGGIVAAGPDVLLAASLLDNPAALGPTANCRNVGPGTLTNDGYNAVSDLTAATCGRSASDVLTAAADLGVLQHNGGPTETRALTPGTGAATAVDGGNPAGYCTGALYGSDQRAVARSATRCAAGAFEPQQAPASAPPPPVAAPAPPADSHPHGRWAPAPYKGPKTKIAPGHHRPGHHKHHGKKHRRR
jgi:hypothetical protein